MLHDFLDAHRGDLIARCRSSAASRHTPLGTPAALDHGIPLFLDQLIRALRIVRSAGDRARALHRAGSDPSGADTSEIGATAMQHGLELSRQGVTIAQAVHAYGDLCQAITELAGETRTPIEVEDFRTLNRCLDDAIAGAVTEFSYQRDTLVADETVRMSEERLHVLFQELQVHVQTATLALGAVESGHVGLKGATGAIVGLSLVSMRTIIKRVLADAQDGSRALARH